MVFLRLNLKTLVRDIIWFPTRKHVSCPTLLSLDMSGNVDIANVASIAEVSASRKLKFDFRVCNDYQG